VVTATEGNGGASGTAGGMLRGVFSKLGPGFAVTTVSGTIRGSGDTKSGINGDTTVGPTEDGTTVASLSGTEEPGRKLKPH